MEDGDQILPFARCFHGSPSTYLWEDEMGNTQEIPQGDPLMPTLFSLGEHPALEAIQRRLADGEKLLAYLDDVMVISRPERVRTVITIIDEELARHAHLNIHYGKTHVWNRGGVAPQGIDELARLARLVTPDAVVWRGDTQLPVRLLGVPIGSPDFVRQQLEDKSAEQDLLFHRIPLMEDTQACWLLLLMCAATRANFWLRAVHPDQSESFAVRHDTNVWRCMRAVLGVEGVPGTALAVSQLPFSLGGLSLGPVGLIAST